MGYIKHNAIIVTSWKPEMVEQTRAKAEELGMVVSAVAKSRVNGYSSILVAPDGSKEEWEDSAAGDAQRAALRAWLNRQRYDDGSSSIEWCEVAYGADDQSAEIVTHGWAVVMPNDQVDERARSTTYEQSKINAIWLLTCAHVACKLWGVEGQ